MDTSARRPRSAAGSRGPSPRYDATRVELGRPPGRSGVAVEQPHPVRHLGRPAQPGDGDVRPEPLAVDGDAGRSAAARAPVASRASSVRPGSSRSSPAHSTRARAASGRRRRRRSGSRTACGGPPPAQPLDQLVERAGRRPRPGRPGSRGAARAGSSGTAPPPGGRRGTRRGARPPRPAAPGPRTSACAVARADVPTSGADAVGDRHREQPARDVAEHGRRGATVAEPGAGPAGERQRDQRRPTTVTPTRPPGGVSMIVSSGSSAPTVKDEHRRPGGRPRVGEVVGVDAQLGLGVRAERVVGGQLLGDLEGELLAEALVARRCPASSASSSSGSSTSSRRSLSSSACSESRWVLTETYSPAAMLSAPAARPATPAISDRRSGRWSRRRRPSRCPRSRRCRRWRPSTPARSQLSRLLRPSACGSSSCGPTGGSRRVGIRGHAPIVRSRQTARNQGKARQRGAGVEALRGRGRGR